MATFIESRLRLGHLSKLMALGLHCFYRSRLRLGHLSKLMALGLHCFRAYSVQVVCGLCTWGVAPGSVLRFQRA